MIGAILLGGVLLGHGLIHASFLAPRPAPTAGGPAWPFDLEHSWLFGALGVRSSPARVVGTALVLAALAGFSLAALAAIGAAPAALWAPAIAIGAVASLGVLSLFFHPWLVLGLAIDLALLWAVFIAQWMPPIGG